MQGISGTFSINGTELTLQPSSGRWVEKEIVGYDGSGRPVYPAVGEFDLSWDLVPTSDLKQLIDFYDYVSNTGTCVADLPKWGDNEYMFYSYSGTFPNRPTVGDYFVGYVTDVKMKISNIRTK